MIDTNSVQQGAAVVAEVKTQLSPYVPAMIMAGAWLARELRGFNHWLFDLLEYFIAHGGVGRWLLKVVWAPKP